MSTSVDSENVGPVGSVKNPTIVEIFHYGKECLLNRAKVLFILVVVTFSAPQILAFFLTSRSVNEYVDAIKSGALNGGNILEAWSLLMSSTLWDAVLVHLASGLLALLGFIAMARVSLDYFEQRPSKAFPAIWLSFKVLLKKGPGAFVMLLAVLLPASVLALLRVVVLCLLLMLPMELTASPRGGMQSVWSVVFLKYIPTSSRQGSRWPAFSNMMTVGGLTLSLLFLSQMLLLYILEADIFLGLQMSWWTSEINVAGISIASHHLLVQFLDLSLKTLIFGTMMPFLAAFRYLSQSSSLNWQLGRSSKSISQ